MAKDLTPSPELREASYTVNSYMFGENYSQCPLFDGSATRWRGGGDAYWWNDDCNLDITINNQCNIYRLSQSDYYAESHQQPFTIKRYVNNKWVDVTNKHPQTLKYEAVQWVKTISNLPSGRYRFTSVLRMDAEWFIEKVNKKHLYLKDDTVYGILVEAKNHQ